jgi:hypothetical protein
VPEPVAQLVYVCGSGHSGSTLLDLLLGGHSKIAALGEAHRIYLGAHHSSRLHRCVCGAELYNCPFWQRVARELEQMLGVQDPDVLRSLPTTDPGYLRLQSDGDYLTPTLETQRPPRTLGDRLAVAAMMSGSKTLWRITAKTVASARRDHASASNSLKVFEAVRRATGRPVIVDSTKNPGRMRALYLESELPMRLVYLIRDGRAVCHSRVCREGISMQRAAKAWVAEHRRQRVAQLTIPGDRILRVQYEHLCRDPGEELDRICRFIGTTFEPAMLDFRNDQRHGVGGNAMRFRTDETTIRLDERWRSEMSAEDRAEFNVIAGRTNARLGYSE